MIPLLPGTPSEVCACVRAAERSNAERVAEAHERLAGELEDIAGRTGDERAAAVLRAEARSRRLWAADMRRSL